MQQIYLDYNASTPLLPEVANVMKPYLYEHFGNPSSSHLFGISARRAVEIARKQVASLINCKPEEIVFTSGGTESNNYAIKGTAWNLKNKGNHIITSEIEHPAVLEVCRYLEKQGFEITYLPVDHNGLIDPNTVKKAIKPTTIMITIMHANNEVGTIEPIEEIAKIAKANNIVFHTDAAQSLGKIPVNVQELNVDLLSIAGHKIYAPKGIGALYIRKGITLEKLIHGANHEHDLRAGTENVLEIVGLGKAAQLAEINLSSNMNHCLQMRDKLFAGLIQNLQNVVKLHLNGHPEQRLPNTLNIGFTGLNATDIILELDQLAISAGAACHSDIVNISHVLEAMETSIETAKGSIRFSTGILTTSAEIDDAIKIITKGIKNLLI